MQRQHFCRLARLTSVAQLWRPSEAVLGPWVLVVSVVPPFLMLNMAGARPSHQSLWKAIDHFRLDSLFAAFWRMCFRTFPGAVQKGRGQTVFKDHLHKTFFTFIALLNCTYFVSLVYLMLSRNVRKFQIWRHEYWVNPSSLDFKCPKMQSPLRWKNRSC